MTCSFSLLLQLLFSPLTLVSCLPLARCRGKCFHSFFVLASIGQNGALKENKLLNAKEALLNCFENGAERGLVGAVAGRGVVL